jgi:hypothetical protein
MLKKTLIIMLIVSSNVLANDNSCYSTDKLEAIAKELIVNFDNDEFISSFKNMISLPEGYARFVYSELSVHTQKRIWLYHTEQFIINETLSYQQKDYIYKYTKFIEYIFHDKIDDEDFKKTNVLMLKEKLKAEDILGKELSYKLINDLVAYFKGNRIKQCN